MLKNNIFVNYEVAQKLKSLGFNNINGVFYFYVKPKSKIFGIDEKNRYYPIKNLSKKLYNSKEHFVLNVENIILAPIYYEVLDWLRTKYFINIKIEYLCSVNEVLALVGVIDFMINKHRKPDIHINSTSLDYYQVLEETINETLNIIEKWKM